MSHLGKDKGFDYLELPYLPDWEPEEERAWAARYIDEKGNEDFAGFEAEYVERFPEMIKSGVMAFLPKSVNYYVRHSRKGRRMDVDWELAEMPLTDEERRLIKERKEAGKRKRRLDALKARAESAEDQDREVPEVVQSQINLLEEIENARE